MAFKLGCPDSALLTIEHVENDSEFSTIQPDLEKFEVIHGPSVDLSKIEDFQTNTAANDLLQNGILVETNKGLVCMSLKDVLSSNINLSEEDFQKVAAQLLLQQSLSNSDITSDNTDNPDQLEETSSKDIPETVTITTVPSVNTNESLPISIEINYKSNVASSSDESTNVTHSSDNLMIENLNPHMNQQKISTQIKVEVSKDESQSFSSSNLFELEKGKDKPNITKRRGGWPKGRKRKPELLNLPPKAPKTSYNIFLNERRKLYKDKLAFHEITRVVGNQWSSLSAEEKQPYIEKALEDKMRYRQELMAYRQSDAYKLYLARKRKKRAMDNLLSESDMDGTDDFDDEPDDLYCDMCDQWFYNLHNKREHLLSRQHKMLVADDMTRELASSDSEYKGHISSVSFSTSLDESSLDAAPVETVIPIANKSVGSETVSDFMSHLLGTVLQREKEIQILQAGLNKAVAKKTSYMLELSSLKEKANLLRAELSNLKQQNIVIETQIYQLWQTIFLVNNSETEKNEC